MRPITWASAKCSCAKRVKALQANWVDRFYGLLAVVVTFTSLLALPAHADDTISALNRAERYLNEITTLTADFTQVAPDGAIAEGKLFLKRPGKMRWEYAPPNPILMVSDGDTFVYHDKEMNEVSYLSLDDTLAAFIAKPKINFADESLRVVDVREGAGSLRFTIFKNGRMDEGLLTLVFRTQPLRLHQLAVMDGSGGLTELTLDNVQRGMQLDDEMFIFKRSLLETK